MATSIRTTRAEIDLDALERNFRSMRAFAPGIDVLAMVKANAYGHGAPAVAKRLEAAGVRCLGVALVEEGLELRNFGVHSPVLVMGGAYEGGYEAMVSRSLTPVLFRVDHLDQLAAAARAAGRQVAFHLKVDTGMTRLGATLDELPPLLARLKDAPELHLEGLCTHVASADLKGSAQTPDQLQRFARALDEVRDAGFQPELRHAFNSAALLGLRHAPEEEPFNLARAGIALYGYAPAAWLGGHVPLEPVLSWKTSVIHVKAVQAGASVSYGATWTAKRPSRIATLPVGYADGYFRAYSSRAQVLIRGRRAPIVGRVCMDMCMVDVTDVPGADLGDEVVLLGRQGDQQVDAVELARLADTIPYEVLCAISGRVPRALAGEP